MIEWQEVRGFGVPLLTWWEVLVKPGIRKLALERGRELSRAKQSVLNLLIMRQSYMTRKIYAGEEGWLTSLKEIQLRIEDWYQSELQKVKYQS